MIDCKDCINYEECVSKKDAVNCYYFIRNVKNDNSKKRRFNKIFYRSIPLYEGKSYLEQCYVDRNEDSEYNARKRN